MRWFIKNVYPDVLQAVPTVRLVVAGGRPTREVIGWGAMQSVEVTGFVEDIRKYIGVADVCIAPLRIARGIQNKVLEAMAMSKAVVATPQALEGIDLVRGTHALLAESTRDFAAAIIELLHERQRACLLGQEARRFAEQHFSWDAKLRDLGVLLELDAAAAVRKQVE